MNNFCIKSRLFKSHINLFNKHLMGPVVAIPFVVEAVIAVVGAVGAAVVVTGVVYVVKTFVINRTQDVENLQKQLELKNFQIERLRKNNCSDQERTEIVIKIVNAVESYKFDDVIPKQDGTRHYMIIGELSSGKTSLLNEAFKLALPVGVDDATKQIKEVVHVTVKGIKIKIFDSQGLTLDNAITAESLAVLANMDKIFLVYQEKLESKVSQDLIQLLVYLKKEKCVIVKAQCDKLDKISKNACLEQLMKDAAYVEKVKVKAKIFATSSKMATSYRDNLYVLQELRGK